MLDLLFFNKILTLIALIAIGYFWEKKKLPFNKNMIMSIVMNIGIPALLIASINNEAFSTGNIIRVLLYGTLIIIPFTVFTFIYLKFEKKPIRAFMQSFIFPNTGGLGIPIAYVLLGEKTFIYAIAFANLINIYHYTIGLWLTDKSLNFKKVLQMPMMYALATLLIFKSTNTFIPNQIAVTLGTLETIIIPLSLIVFGSSLANIKIDGNIKIIRMGIIRVFCGFIVAYLSLSFWGFEKILVNTLIIQYSMPIASTSYLFSLKFKGPSDEVAIMSASSTITMLCMLPVIFYLIV